MFSKLLAMLAFVKTSFGLDGLVEFAQDTKAQMGGRDLPSVAILVVIAGVVLFVGIQIMSQVVQNTSLESGDPFYNATQTLEQDFNNAFGTFGLAVTIVIFSVIIVYLYGLRGGGRGR